MYSSLFNLTLIHSHKSVIDIISSNSIKPFLYRAYTTPLALPIDFILFILLSMYCSLSEVLIYYISRSKYFTYLTRTIYIPHTMYVPKDYTALCSFFVSVFIVDLPFCETTAHSPILRLLSISVTRCRRKFSDSLFSQSFLALFMSRYIFSYFPLHFPLWVCRVVTNVNILAFQRFPVLFHSLLGFPVCQFDSYHFIVVVCSYFFRIFYFCVNF